MRRARALIVMLAASAATTGCANLPIVGNLGARIEPLLPAFVRDRLFPSQAASAGSSDGSADSDTLPIRHRQRTAASLLAAAPGSGSSPVATTDPQVVMASEVAVNIQFDHLRTVGLDELYMGQTAQALKSFQAALQLRPNDGNVQDLIRLIQHPTASNIAINQWANTEAQKIVPELESSFNSFEHGAQGNALAPELPQPPGEQTAGTAGGSPASLGGSAAGTGAGNLQTGTSNPAASLLNLPPTVHLNPVPPPPSQPTHHFEPPAGQVPILRR